MSEKMSRQEAGRKGGQTTAERYGSEHMSQIGSLGFMATLERHYQGDKARMMGELRARLELSVEWNDRLGCFVRKGAVSEVRAEMN